jgi:aerobic-type carbon monoxide dehydrogenase small subunit (CoxS/CutS family)
VTRPISLEINDRLYEAVVEPRTLLSDFIRHDVGLAGTNVGCEHGVCGACTVQLDEEPVRSCLMLAVQADGRSVRTVEALAGSDGQLHPLQEAFRETHALQCGFCTPGFLMSLESYLREHRDPMSARSDRRSPATSAAARATPGSWRPYASRRGDCGEERTAQEAQRSKRSRPTPRGGGEP